MTAGKHSMGHGYAAFLFNRLRAETPNGVSACGTKQSCFGPPRSVPLYLKAVLRSASLAIANRTTPQSQKLGANSYCCERGNHPVIRIGLVKRRPENRSACVRRFRSDHAPLVRSSDYGDTAAASIRDCPTIRATKSQATRCQPGAGCCLSRSAAGAKRR